MTNVRINRLQRLPRSVCNAKRRRLGGASVAVALALALVLSSGCVSVNPDWRNVRLVRDRVDVEGCTLLTILKDEDMNDLRKRAAESGGDTVLLTGSEGSNVPIVNPTRFVADVYRCAGRGRA